VLAAGLVAAVLLNAGCAVGRFIVGAPSPDARSAAAPAAHATPSAQAMLALRCSGCHAIPDPGAMSGDAWGAALERMKRRMRLRESEWDSLAAMSTHDVHH
jgi:hypothetical protein